MSPRDFDRFMVALEAPSNPKVRRLKRAGKDVRWAWFHGVLPIAAKAPLRGSFCIGNTPADVRDVADQAEVTVAEARKALDIARELGMLERDEHGIEWVHDFHVYNPEPKRDLTAAERARRYRDRQRSRDVRDATSASHRDDRDDHGGVTPPEVEGEVEVHPPSPPRGERSWSSPPVRPPGKRKREGDTYDQEVAAYATWLLPDEQDPAFAVRTAIGWTVPDVAGRDRTNADVRRLALRLLHTGSLTADEPDGPALSDEHRAELHAVGDRVRSINANAEDAA